MQGEPDFQEARAPTSDELQSLLARIIARLMKMLTRLGYLVEEDGMTHIADMDTDSPLASLQSAACTYLGVPARAPPRAPARRLPLFETA